MTSHSEPVRASDILQERVDETAKDRHEPEPEQQMRIEHAGHVSPKPWPTQFDNDPSKWYEQIGKLPKREWVGLTDEEIIEVVGQITTYRGEYMVCVGNAIEAKLREKNGG
jgi:hypothetical protein